MKERYILILLIILFVMFLVDFYAFKGLKLLLKNNISNASQLVVFYMYWGFSAFFWLAMVVIFLRIDIMVHPLNSHWSFLVNSIIMMMVLSKLIFSAFHLADDLLHLAKSLVIMVASNFKADPLPGEPITRWKFLTYLGAAFFTLSISSIGYGIFRGRFDFRVIQQNLKFPNLPKSFSGLKIVHISDIHIGSFPKRHPSVIRAIETINELKPDIILFTGDLVNNLAQEVEGWQDIFSRLDAKIGKFSVLGNHDYGDYYQWPDLKQKANNLTQLKNYHAQMGFQLMLNDNIPIEKNNEKLHIIGVENWGKPPFVQYGDLQKATRNVEENSFKILLSHDPSHWDEQVIKQTKIDLTLSGHTHGMQFGIEIPGIKWSPVKYKYPRWGGLYQEGKQFLYVNRGFGYIGFSGRVGMPPEITLLTLETA